MIRILLFIVIVFVGMSACNNRNVQAEQEEKTQVRTVDSGLLMIPDEKLNSEQKELKAKIYQVLLDCVEVDTVTNHLRLTLTKQEFIDKGLDENLYQECISNIDAVNAYADQSGKGREMLDSWIKSKDDFVQMKK